MNSLLGRPDEHTRQLFMVTQAFLEGRLAERRSYEWALALPAAARTERQAVAYLLDAGNDKKMQEPWLNAWRLLEEAWASEDNVDFASVHSVKPLLEAGDLSGSTIEKITRLVRPRIKLSAISTRWKTNRNVPERPRRLGDLVSVSLDSGPIVNPITLGLDKVHDGAALIELGHSLEAAVQYGMNLGQRLGWTTGGGLWRLGSVYRVYFVSSDENGDDNEPDRFHEGIAPAVKLLYAVVERLVVVDLVAARQFADRWRANPSEIHCRLWAAIARSANLASGDEVAAFLLALDQRRFWNMSEFPEIAELRARRFADFPPVSQQKIAQRLLAAPPRTFWSRRVGSPQISEYRAHWVGQEIRRIQIAGAELPEQLAEFLREQLAASPQLGDMAAVDAGFMETAQAEWVPSRPDRTLDTLTGKERLDALERALTSGRRGIDDHPAQRATDWIGEGRNADAVLADLESVGDAAGQYPVTLDVLGSRHRRENDRSDSSEIASGIVDVLIRLPEATIERAVHGITQWISHWEKEISRHPKRYELWEKVWPVAVASTNAQQSPEEEPDLNVVVRSNAGEKMDLDALNAPSGHMMSMFLSACPNLEEAPRPFETQDDLRRMREDIVAVNGRSRLIALHRMVASLPYFLNADRDWAQQNLVAPLKADDAGTAALWRAVSRNMRTSALEALGTDVTRRVLDVRLGRESRKALIWTLVVEAIQSKWKDKDPVVAYSDIQQALRSVEDEIRAHAAGVVRRFVADMSAPRTDAEPSPTVERLFSKAALPFLESVWPQERSVTTPGVASAFARLPAACGAAFADAVHAITRFLVPFDCWSLLDFGLYGDDSSGPKLARIDNAEKAEALIVLLDACIGTAEGAIVPYDLDKALEHVRSVAPTLSNEHRFRRLAALARR